MKRFATVSSGPSVPLLICLLMSPMILPASLAWAQQSDEPASGVTVERVTDKGLMLIKIPAVDGKVAWEDVLRALLRAGHMEDNALKDSFPSGALDLERAYSRYSLLAINLTMAPDIRMEIVAKTDNAPAHLLVTVNEDAIQERKRRMSKKIRNRITGGALREGKFGLRFADDWEGSDPQQPLVIVVHGFNSSPERFAPVADAFRRAGMLCATYSYPDDQPIAESAEQLSADLRKLHRDQSQRSVFLVTHSMGGLVSRSVIEQPELNPGNVTKLIMIAPPTHGSLLAHFAFGIDILDHATSGAIPDDVTRFYEAVEDGLSEAKNDLKPNSRFLRQLNARSLNPEVSYSIFLGTGGRMSQSRINQLREGLKTASDRSTTVGLFAPHLDETLADLEEVIKGKGDGVVAVKRGRLEGVTDTVVADFTHLGVLQTADTFEDDEIFLGVLQRLKK